MPEARAVVAAARPARVFAALLAVSGLLGCVQQKAATATPAATAGSPVPGAGTPPSAPPAAPESPGAATSTSAAPVETTPPATPPSPPARAAAGTAARAPAPKRPAAAAVPAGPPAALPPAAPPVLDLATLEERLRDTHAIGLFTKLSLKNQVDDLLAQFRAFYAGQGGPPLAELRRSYELLLMKVVTLLQDADPGLASAVSSSREAIWAILSDRSRFNNL